MTTVARKRSGWGQTRTQRSIACSLPIGAHKQYTVSEDPSFSQLIECYGYLLFQPNGHLWLTNLVPKNQREIVAERIRILLSEARAANMPGKSLVLC